MPEFKIPADIIPEMKRKQFLGSLPVILLGFVGGYAMILFTQKPDHATFQTILLTIPIIIVTSWIGIRMSMNRLDIRLSTYTLILSESGISRQQSDTETITIQKEDIQKIIRSRDGNFTVKGSNRRDQIIIPNQIEKPDELEMLLNGLLPVSQNEKKYLWQKYRALTSIVTIIPYVVVVTSKNKTIVLSCGSFVLIVMIASLIAIQTNKNINRKTKRMLWIVLLPMLSVVMAMIDQFRK